MQRFPFRIRCRERSCYWGSPHARQVPRARILRALPRAAAAPSAYPPGAIDYSRRRRRIAAADPRVSRRRDGPPRPQPRDRIASAVGHGVRHRRPTQTRFDIEIPGERAHRRRARDARAGGRRLPARRTAERARRHPQESAVGRAARWRANYPTIRLRCTDVVAAGEGFDVGVEITIKDQRAQRARARDVRAQGRRAHGERRVSAQAVGARIQALQRRPWARWSCSTRCACASRSCAGAAQ